MNRDLTSLLFGVSMTNLKQGRDFRNQSSLSSVFTFGDRFFIWRSVQVIMELEQAKRDYDQDMATADSQIGYMSSTLSESLNTRDNWQKYSLVFNHLECGDSIFRVDFDVFHEKRVVLNPVKSCREVKRLLKELVAASKRLQENQRLLDLRTADRVAAAAAAARSQLHAIARDVKSSTVKVTPSKATLNEGNSNSTKSTQTMKVTANTTRSKFSLHRLRAL